MVPPSAAKPKNLSLQYCIQKQPRPYFQLQASILFILPQRIVIFYTDILTKKVVLWSFFTDETSEKSHNSTFRVKISVQNVIFSNEMEKQLIYCTYFSIEFGKETFLVLTIYVMVLVVRSPLTLFLSQVLLVVLHPPYHISSLCICVCITVSAVSFGNNTTQTSTYFKEYTPHNFMGFDAIFLE